MGEGKPNGNRPVSAGLKTCTTNAWHHVSHLNEPSLGDMFDVGAYDHLHSAFFLIIYAARPGEFKLTKSMK